MATHSLVTDHEECSRELTLQHSYSSGEDIGLTIQCPLPLPLQSLSLLMVISDLDSYPVEILASLPLWLRYRLLNSLPVFDLCRLDHTPVAKGVDMDEIWGSRRISSVFRYNALENNCAPFCVPSWAGNTENSIMWPAEIPDLDPELEAALNKIPNVLKETVTCDDVNAHQLDEIQLANDARGAYLLKVAYGILNILDPKVVSPKIIGDWLISIKGDLLMKNLTTATHKHGTPSQTDSSQPEEDHYQLWNTQGNALVTYQDASSEIRLAPHRLLPIRNIADPLEMFSILIHDCGLQPSALTFNYKMFDCYMEMSSQNKERFVPLFLNFLHNVSVLGLVNNTGTELRECKTIIEGVVGDGKNCQLKVLCCSLPKDCDGEHFMKCLSPSLFSLSNHDPPCYKGLCALDIEGLGFASVPHLTTLLQQQPLLKIVHIVLKREFDNDPTSPIHDNHPDTLRFFNVLGSLFSRMQFQELSIAQTMHIHPLSLNELIKGFISAPCPHLQQLRLTTSLDPEFCNLPEMSISEVASATVSGAKFQDCGIQHKILICDTKHLLHHLLYLPTIRLREIGLECTDYGHGNNYLHLSALHPDLRVSGLRLTFFCDSDNIVLQDTIHDDFKILLKMPTLVKLSVLGCWWRSQEAMAALMQGLKEQSKVGSIQKITFRSLYEELSAQEYGSSGLFTKLWDAVFTLPQIDNLEVIIYGNEVLQMMKQCEQAIYESWKQTMSGHKLKKLKFINFSFDKEDDNLISFELLESIAQTVTYTSASMWEFISRSS